MLRSETIVSKNEAYASQDQLKNETEVASQVKDSEAKSPVEESKAVTIINTTDQEVTETQQAQAEQSSKQKISY